MKSLSEKDDLQFMHLTEQIDAITKKPMRIQELRRPHLQVQEAAVSTNPYAIKHIRQPSEKIRTMALYSCGLVLKYIPFPTPSEMEIAIKQNPKALEFIPDNLREVYKMKLDKYQQSIVEAPKEQTEEKRVVVSKHIWESLTEDEILDILEDDPEQIEFIPNPSEDMQLVALYRPENTPLIKKIQNPTNRVCKYIISRDPTSILYLQNPHRDHKVLALSKKPILLLNQNLFSEPFEQEYIITALKDKYTIQEVFNMSIDDVKKKWCNNNKALASYFDQIK